MSGERPVSVLVFSQTFNAMWLVGKSSENRISIYFAAVCYFEDIYKQTCLDSLWAEKGGNLGSQDGRYVTPKSDTILQSTTNIMLQQLARDRGMIVEERPIDFAQEIENFKEIGILPLLGENTLRLLMAGFWQYSVKSFWVGFLSGCLLNLNFTSLLK